MTDREKCFVLNTVRAYYRTAALAVGEDPDKIDSAMWPYCEQQGLTLELLDETRREAETLLKGVFAGRGLLATRGN